jgi:hypothetical protein
LVADEDQADDEMSVCDDDDNVEGDDDDEDRLAAEEVDNPDDNINELDALPEGDRDKILAETAAVCATVSKLRNLPFAIINSTTLALPVWRRICKTHKLKSKLIPRDVVTRWNSTYDLLVFALRYRVAIDAITADKKLKLRKYELYDIDWVIVDDLTVVLEQYKKATLYFSSDSASICAVIPAMDQMENKLHPRTNKPLHPAIVSAMKLAHLKLNRYYSLTDLSSIYRIAMGVYLTS